MKPDKTLQDLWKIKEELYQEKERRGLTIGEWLDEIEKSAEEFIKKSGYRKVKIAPGMYKITH